MACGAGDCNSSNSFAMADPRLGPRGTYGGLIPLYPLLAGSPAINAGDPEFIAPPDTDQRGAGFARVSAGRVDIGAFESSDVFVVGSAGDSPDETPRDGICATEASDCTLRAAIEEGNAIGAARTIIFSTAEQIQPAGPLPPITAPLAIDGGWDKTVLDGASAGIGSNGIAIAGSGSRIINMEIRNFGGAGISVSSGVGNRITHNSIHDNGGLGIELGNGVTAVHKGEPGEAFPNNAQNYPVLFKAISTGESTSVSGLLHGDPTRSYSLEFYSSSACDSSNFGEGQVHIGDLSVTTNGDGDAAFTAAELGGVTGDDFITATGTDPDGNTSGFSPCITVGPDNTSWQQASTLTPAGSGDLLEASTQQYLDIPGQSRWYKLWVPAQSALAVYLGNLAADYDLFVFRDIQSAYDALQGEVDPVLEAQNNTHGQVAPLQYQPLQYHPLQYQPLQYQPLQYHPLQYQPLQYQPLAYDETDYGTAQTQSLIGGSMLPGTTNEAVIVNSWNRPGNFYIRVAGRDAAFSLQQPFSLDVDLLTAECGSLNLSGLRPGSMKADSGNPKTLILTDMDRMAGSSADKAALQARLASLAARPEVNGEVIDVGADERVQDTSILADANPKCPYAKNLVAEAIKRIVDLYRGPNSALHDVVIVGSDHVIPFYRYPDSTPLGSESTYDVPVDSQSPSEASLRNNFALTQDVYGSRVSVSLTASQFPVPDLGVGRLVQTPAEVVTMLDAYLGASRGRCGYPADFSCHGLLLHDAYRTHDGR